MKPAKFNPAQPHCAIVTGAAGGIGFQFCRTLLLRGIDVVLVDISQQRLDESRKTLSGEFPAASVTTYAIDLTSADVCTRLEAFCSLNKLNPDILINNAGIFSFLTVGETSENKIDCFIDLHVRTVTMLSRWFVNRRAKHGSGWLLNMSSMSCWMPMPGIALYSATKAYIRVFTRALALEARDAGISVTAACPGGIATNLFGLPPNLLKLAVRIGALDVPDRFARKAVDKTLLGKNQYINGFINRLSILFVSILPARIRMMIKHRLLDRGITR